jgi:hypothetical protein
MAIIYLSQFGLSSVFAQAKSQSDPESVVIKDLVLENVLSMYCKEVNTKVVAIIVERYDGDYTYTLCSIGTFDEVVKNPTTLYRRWKDRMLLIYSGPEAVFTIDSTQIKSFYKEMRTLLPDGHSAKMINKGLYEITAIASDPIIWRFKVDNNKILWLRKNLDYELEKILYFK